MSELSVENLVQKYLSDEMIIQLATTSNNQPWLCNLHFIADEQSNVYWISKSSRRHSQEIVDNPNVAIAIAIQTEKPLVGLQAEGVAEQIAEPTKVRTIMDAYMERHGTDASFVDSIVAGTNEHKLYVFHPKRFSLFDQVNFPDQPQQMWLVNNK